ncbi:LEF-5 [Urbanus proteus nucleopolyhedrovirus]|uniref:LEF-5 n=1 Tax=Urbanus proteus nucleopolyhedrovirus TaxID=1675866 RepID=A0A162GU15_9ABAC|nr:LEF-5 [Urbanus proteus nucleopolyhedrovirus]AKR17313.1 LEF-5 [Urbanus proteus nucleopolyhedrovirus]
MIANPHQVTASVQHQNLSVEQTNTSAKHEPCDFDAHDKQLTYKLFLQFKHFRNNELYDELIDFLIKEFPSNVKNKTFNFTNSKHLFHSLYAYIPVINNIEKERKQIRLSKECIKKLFLCTINDFKLYCELFDMINANKMKESCPCQLLLKRKREIQLFVDTIKAKKFDTKPPKLKKEHIDSIMYKYSLNWKNVLLKKKNIKSKTKKKCKKNRNIINDNYIKYAANGARLSNINGFSLNSCNHKFVTQEKQMRAGDEAVSFIVYCTLCNQIKH